MDAKRSCPSEAPVRSRSQCSRRRRDIGSFSSDRTIAAVRPYVLVVAPVFSCDRVVFPSSDDVFDVFYVSFFSSFFFFSFAVVADDDDDVPFADVSSAPACLSSAAFSGGAIVSALSVVLFFSAVGVSPFFELFSGGGGGGLFACVFLDGAQPGVGGGRVAAVRHNGRR